MNDLVLNLLYERIGKSVSMIKIKIRFFLSYEYHLLMNEQIEVLMLEFQIALDEKAIDVLLDVLMDQIRDIAKQDP
jgi:hypothetical protein